MIRAELAVAAVALVSTGAVASAQAQTQTASAEPTIWDHNGSVVYLAANGQSREFHYQSLVQGCWMWVHVLALFSSAVKSITHNIPERHIFLARIADQSRSKSKERFSTMMNELS